MITSCGRDLAGLGSGLGVGGGSTVGPGQDGAVGAQGDRGARRQRATALGADDQRRQLRAPGGISRLGLHGEHRVVPVIAVAGHVAGQPGPASRGGPSRGWR